MSPPARRRFLAVALLLTAAAPAIAAEAPTPVHFHPGWFPSAQFTGVFVALDSGLYADAGLDVTLFPFAYGQDSTAQLSAHPGVATLGSIEGYILLQKMDAGDDLVAAAPLLQSSPAGVMSLASAGIRSAADFAHRPVGVHAYADALFAWFAANAGLRPNETQFVRVEDDVSALLTGEVDAMQGYASEEYVRLQARAAPRATRFLSFADLGFPSYSEILYTTRKQWRDHGPVLARFVAATREGWRRAYADPARAVPMVVARAGPDADAAHIAAALTALRPYVMGEHDDPLPPMSPERWRTLQRIAREMGLIESAVPPDPATWLVPLD